MQNFFNTINAVGDQLHAFREDAQLKKNEILSMFQKEPKREFRTWDIELESGLNHDTVKRSITGLTDDGKLIRSKKAHKMGPYGKNVNTWRLA